MEISIKELLVGFTEAYSRYRIAKNETDKLKLFVALFETLNWVVSIDDNLRLSDNNWFKQYGDDGVIKGIRYARNRVHHQWADILILNKGGATLPAELPFAFHEWMWRPLNDVPVPVDKKHRVGEEDYIKYLANKPARSALSVVSGLFEKAIK